MQLINQGIKAAQIFKIVKRFSDSFQFLFYKMKTYKRLGECFQIRESKLSYLYVIKMLLCAWKL